MAAYHDTVRNAHILNIRSDLVIQLEMQRDYSVAHARLAELARHTWNVARVRRIRPS
jgi:hypothetical protein